jgi:heme/copper-type cytochrome/quinol oxidase subunit 2
MSQLIIAALAFIFIPLGIFFLLGWLIFYHLRRYGLEGDSTKKTAIFFSAVLILISALIIAIFLFTDWNSISIEDFLEKSNINLYPTEYE